MTVALRPMPYMPAHYQFTVTKKRRPLLPSLPGWAAFKLGPHPAGG